MLTMIFKMTAVTALYVLLTALIWKLTRKKAITGLIRLLIGLVYAIYYLSSRDRILYYLDKILRKLFKPKYIEIPTEIETFMC